MIQSEDPLVTPIAALRYPSRITQNQFATNQNGRAVARTAVPAGGGNSNKQEHHERLTLEAMIQSQHKPSSRFLYDPSSLSLAQNALILGFRGFIAWNIVILA